MNILHTECSLNWGGQEYRTLLEHLYLNANGHRSWLMCHPQSELYRKAIEKKAPNLVAVNLRQTWRIDVALRIFLFCLRHRIDIINAHGSRDSTLCIPGFLSGIPLVRSRQIINPIKKGFGYRYLCSQVLASAAIIKSALQKAGVPAEKITVVNEGIDLDEFTPLRNSDYLRQEFSLDEHDTAIINIGMIRGDKGQRYFLEAARLLLKSNRSLKFFLVGASAGDKTLEKEIRSKIYEYGIEKNFIMTGYRDDIPAFMHCADFIVIASTHEAQSRIAPEAFATARTVIATKVGGLPEVVNHGENGLLVPAKDPLALAAAMAILLNDRPFKVRLEKNAYQYALNNLSFSQMMEKILLLYSRLIDENNPNKAKTPLAGSG